MAQQDSVTLGQLWLLRDGAYLRARRMMVWPVQPGLEHELSPEQQALLAEYRWLDEQVRRQRHQLQSLAFTR